jgi:DTW domain-containing protein YfiP
MTSIDLDLSDESMEQLREIAAKTGHTVEEVALELLRKAMDAAHRKSLLDVLENSVPLGDEDAMPEIADLPNDDVDL